MDAFSDIFAFLSGVPAAVALVLTALTIFLTSDWRLSLTALLVQYVFVGVALTSSVQGEVAVVKILAGVMAVFILYLTARRMQEEQEVTASEREKKRFLGLSLTWHAGPLGLPLRLMAVILLVLALVLLFGDYQFPLVSASTAFIAVWMAALGALGLLVGSEPLRVAAAILTILAAFDLVYAALEQSLAVVGFWSALTIMAALALSYLALVKGLSKEQPQKGDEGMGL
jgi:hypothetical protein